jgi:hypothetical protein
MIDVRLGENEYESCRTRRVIYQAPIILMWDET